MISAALQKAIDCLQIQDVYLRDFAAHCNGDFDPKYTTNFDALVVQSKHFVKQSMVVKVNEQQLLRILVTVGARWVDDKLLDEAAAVKVAIEAEFVAEYAFQGALEKSSIDEFSLKNVSYHIWPYWRELLSSQCDRMHLPKIVWPMVQLAHNRHSQHPNDDIRDADAPA